MLLLAASARADLVCTAEGRVLEGAVRFDGEGVVVTQRTGPTVKLDPTKIIGMRLVGPAPILKQGLVLLSGSAIPVEEIVRGDARVVRVKRTGGAVLDVPAEQVAEVVFDGTAPVKWPKAGAAEGNAQVLLRTGDVLQGEVTELTGAGSGRLVLGSMLFGERVFEGKNLIAVRFRQPSSAPTDAKATYHVRLVDGTAALSSLLKADQGKILFDDPLMGRLSAAREEVSEVRCLGGVEALPVARANEVPSEEVRGSSPWSGGGRAFLVQKDAEQTVDLDGKASALFLRVGVPVSIVPARSVRVVIDLDGARIVRTPQVNSVSEPLVVGLNISGKRKLTIRVEGEGPATEAYVADVIIVRGR